MALSAGLWWARLPPLGSDPATVTSPPPAWEKQGPHACPPEIVARGHIMVQVPGVQAAEGIPGQAVGGGPVQVAVPFDLDAHDAALRGASRDNGLSWEPALE